jgi:primosomal protein N' (replication factor Y)
LSLVEVILPLPLAGYFTYKLHDRVADQSLVGCRVIVPFGRRKIYTGLVAKIPGEDHSVDYHVRETIDIIDEQPVVTSYQIKFMEWLASYYMCTTGEVYSAMLPSNLKLTSESYIALHPDTILDEVDLTDQEYELIQFLSKAELSFEEVSQITGVKNPYRIINKLREKGVIYLFEKIKDKYAPKIEKRIRLVQMYVDDNSLNELANQLESKPKQLDVLESYLRSLDILTNPTLNEKGILKKELINSGISESSLKTLIKHGIFELIELKVNRFLPDEDGTLELPVLSEIQKITLEEIFLGFQNHQTVLFKGITGSGKTEMYMSLIQEVINNGGKVLYMLPEIALTTQIISRFTKVFGKRFGVYHSRFSDNERTDIYLNCLRDKYDFIIGVRSSIFLPINGLELIIVDEEHETSYKQFDPAPRYHARDAAIYLGLVHDAKVLLGTATPSLESYYNAKEGKYGYVELNERYDKQPLPEIAYVDLAKAKKRHEIKGQTSNQLLEEIKSSLHQKKQVIIFQNRRGYSPYIECDNCHHIPKCTNCSVSLTYHIYQNELICHYCGYRQYYDPICSSCNQDALKTVGSGTERLEEEMRTLLPDAQIKRMDLDTTRSKYAYQEIIDDFENGEIQILIGTQMVTKGLDFDNVRLVGVYDTDRMIHFPDFRSHERAFHLITQVSGRAGRKKERGKVLVQTSDPDQPLLKHIKEGHLDLFYQEELIERKNFRYPPYHRLIQIVFRHRDKATARAAAEQYHFLTKKDLGEHRILNPVEPIISKIRNYYIYEILVKLERNQTNIRGVRHYLSASRDTLLALPAFKGVLVYFDVDPV